MDSIAIGGVLLVTPDQPPRSVDIVIDDGVFEAVEPAGSISPNRITLDGSGYVAIPGLVNAHTHSHNALSKGFGDVWTLELLLNYGPALNARRTAEDHYWAAMLNALEMLKSGTTSAYDLVIHAPAPTLETMAAVVQAYRDLGMRAVVAPAVADRPFFEIIPGLVTSLPDDLRAELEALVPTPSTVLLSMMDEMLRTFETDELVKLAIAPTIPAQCSDELLTGCARLAANYGVGLHTHLAESRVQAVEGLRRYGTSLTKHLANVGLLGPHFVGAHAVWLDDADARLLADSGSVVAHNPASNLKLASGVAPIRNFLKLGVSVAIGTDGSASSDNQNMFEAMRMASLVSRLRSLDPADWLDSSTTLHCAVLGGGLACDHHQLSGRIEPGAPADLVLLRRESPFLQPANDLNTQLIHSETGAAVDTAIVAGKMVLRDGKSTRVDEANVFKHAQAAIDRVRSLNKAEWEFARRMSPYIVQTCSALALTPLPIERLMLEPPAH